VQPQKGHSEKRCEIQGGGQEMAVIVGYNGKIFNNNNSGEIVLPSPLFTRIWHQIHLNCRYKNFAISLPSQPFLGRHLGFHIFFHYGLFGPHSFFIAGLFWITFCNCILCS